MTDRGPDPASPLFLTEAELRRALELMLFARREMASDIAPGLAERGLGPAHFRALYFIARHPGISVGGLVDLLGVTKQSLARVLDRFHAEGLTEQGQDRADRRRRRLHLTARGAELEQALTRAQTARLARAYRQAGPEAVAGFTRVLAAMLGPESRARLAADREETGR